MKHTGSDMVSAQNNPPRGIPTNGIGSTNNTDHINRGVTLAHIWFRAKLVPIELPRPSTPAIIGRPKGPVEITKVPYAGKDKFARDDEWEKR